jgi:glyoxylase-like metal-dependent hydrolase (beta-lactamase superfamily II)
MKTIRLWGTRGSIPVALTAAQVRAKIEAVLRGARGVDLDSDAAVKKHLDGLEFHRTGTFGGHSSCVEIETGGGEYVLCDLGSGLRPFGGSVLARHGARASNTFHIFVSHVHWDHIMGLPFFVPAFIPGNRVFIYGSHLELEAALRRQQDKPL